MIVPMIITRIIVEIISPIPIVETADSDIFTKPTLVVSISIGGSSLGSAFLHNVIGQEPVIIRNLNTVLQYFFGTEFPDVSFPTAALLSSQSCKPGTCSPGLSCICF